MRWSVEDGEVAVSLPAWLDDGAVESSDDLRVPAASRPRIDVATPSRVRAVQWAPLPSTSDMRKVTAPVGSVWFDGLFPKRHRDQPLRRARLNSNSSSARCWLGPSAHPAIFPPMSGTLTSTLPSRVWRQSRRRSARGASCRRPSPARPSPRSRSRRRVHRRPGRAPAVDLDHRVGGLEHLAGEAGEVDVDGPGGADHEAVAVGSAFHDLDVAIAGGLVAGPHGVGVDEERRSRPRPTPRRSGHRRSSREHANPASPSTSNVSSDPPRGTGHREVRAEYRFDPTQRAERPREEEQIVDSRRGHEACAGQQSACSSCAKS